LQDAGSKGLSEFRVTECDSEGEAVDGFRGHTEVPQVYQVK
jgi:hypothetical protein